MASASGRVHGVLGFSWARERTLLPLAPGREVWEDLYPAGSVLKLYNVQVAVIIKIMLFFLKQKKTNFNLCLTIFFPRF